MNHQPSDLSREPPRARSSPSKSGYYILEGLNSFATAYYFNYLMFLLRDAHGFTNLNNLTVAALHGVVPRDLEAAKEKDAATAKHPRTRAPSLPAQENVSATVPITA